MPLSKIKELALTLVAYFKGKDGLVLATNSRGTIRKLAGFTAINDAQKRLFQLSKFVGIITYGQAELTAQLIVEAKKTLRDIDCFPENELGDRYRGKDTLTLYLNNFCT